jgi:hypothetical protein
MFCRQCGKQIPDDAVICVACGCAVLPLSPGARVAPLPRPAESPMALPVAESPPIPAAAVPVENRTPPRPATMFCRGCGKEIPMDAVICVGCGRAVVPLQPGAGPWQHIHPQHPSAPHVNPVQLVVALIGIIVGLLLILHAFGALR